MLNITRKLVKHKITVLMIAVLLLIPSAIGFFSTRINYDILYYLPHDIETMKGQDVLLEDFGKGAYGMFVCNGMNSAEVQSLKEKVEKIDHVTEVICFDALTGGNLPKEMLPESIREVFYAKDGSGTLMFLFFDTTTSQDETMDAIDELRIVAGKDCFLSSMSAITTDMKNIVEDETLFYSLLAVALCVVVLLLTTDSFLIPVLFLLSIGFAICYNLGSNFIQGEISFLTMALVAILQLGVTMDYSIFLYHSYKEAKETYEDPDEAMAQAINETIVSVTGSSLTTIAGFLAMCFMTFTLGLDMGVVMAKGVVLGVICCVTVLPALILVFDKAITKTSHKAMSLPTNGITKLVSKYYPIIAIVMLLLWIPAIYGNNHVKVYYKLDESLPEYLPSVQANKEMAKGYNMSSISMVLIDAAMESKTVRKMCEEMEKVDGISFVLSADSLIPPTLPQEFIPKEITNKLQSDNWKLVLVSSEYEIATDEVNNQCEQLDTIIKSYDEDAMLIGEAAATKDLINITNRDFQVVSMVSIGAIFLLILFVLKSISLPFILVIAIELAIYLNMAMSYFMGTTLPFIASVCVGTIQLGATVDYAILMTTRYKKERMAGASKKDAVSIALSTSVNPIFTSALGFFASTVGVALYTDIDLIGPICMLLARGALLSMAIVLTILPALLLIFDGVICATTLDMRGIGKREKEDNRGACYE
ncbi:MAG: MMPL family transporter [Erysipelotrichaceae bacterium]|nr:MMPL family transporter [Erysipelotrichaceae bacterium]